MPNKPTKARPSKRKPQQPLETLVAKAQRDQQYGLHGMLSNGGRRVCLSVSNRSLCTILRRGAPDTASREECRRSLAVNLAEQRKLVARMPRDQWGYYLKTLHAQSGGNV